MSGRKRRAVSEVLATLMMIAITLVAGAAVIGWVNGQAGNSEQAYGNSAANNINNLNERFTPESQVFSNTAGLACNGPSGSGGAGVGCTSASFYLYNDGSVTFTLYSIRIVSTSSSNPLNIILYTACAIGSPGNTCTNPSGGNREVVTAPSPCTVVSPCYPSYEQTGQGLPPTGFYLASGYALVPPLPVSSLSTGSNGPYQITLPLVSGPGQLYMYDGVAYTITFTGLYGNVVQETITANG
jgi:flagellin-like protein